MTPADLYFFDPSPGNKPPVVMLHGLGSDHSSWMLQMDSLSENGFRPIAVDVPGFGRSGFPYSHWTIRRASFIIAKELIDLLPDQIDIIGLSMGGTLAQQLVKSRPEKINNLMLVSTFAKLRPSPSNNLPYLSKRLRLILAADIRNQAGAVADRIFPSSDQAIFHDYLYQQIQSANPRIYRQAMLSLAVFNSTRWMRNWANPTLVVAGSEDSTVTLQNQKRLSRIPRNVRLEVIPGGGHAITIDHAALFNKIMIDFLTEK